MKGPDTGPDLQRTIEELAKELQGLDYRQAEQRMRVTYRLAWLRILEQAQRLVRDPNDAPRQLRTLFRSVSANLQQASNDARGWMKEFLPQALQAGLKQSDMQMQKQGFKRPINASFSLVHRDAVEVISRDSMSDLLKATQLTEDRVKSKVRKLVKDEVEGLVATGQRATGKRIAERLAEDKIFGITASNGRFIPMEEYGRIVAHVKLREAHTKGVEQLIKDNGLDLVRISMHLHKPDLCTPLEGKVYSLSGNDARFPKLPRHTPFHIGCRHVETPFVARFFDDEELSALGAQSRAQRPVEVYTPKELEAADESRKQRERQREQQRLVEQQHEKDVASRKQTVASAMDQEKKATSRPALIASTGKGPTVSIPKGLRQTHVDTMIDLLRQGKVKVANDLAAHLQPPFENETPASVQDRVIRELGLLPQPLLDYWKSRFEDVFEVVGKEHGETVAAGYRWKESRAFAEVASILESPGTATEEVVHILDHRLGDKETAFSEGGGINLDVKGLGQQLLSIYQANPTAVGGYASKNLREYLAAAVRFYLGGPNQKQVLRSKSERLFEFVEQVWFNDERWKEVLKGENLQ